MIWHDFLSTILFSIIGYLIGSISNAIIVSKLFAKEDIRTKGSGNAGATNTFRNYGKLMGGIVFILDALKVVISIMIAWSIKKYSGVEWLSGIVLQIVGFSVIVGHIWPIFFKFKGGKGAACTFGLVLMMNWPVAILGTIAFITTVSLTKKVSLGSMIAATVVIPFQIAFAFIPYMNDPWANPVMRDMPWWVDTITLLLVDIVVIIKHIPNIKRLINGNENTI